MQDFKTVWKNLHNTKQATAANMIQYCILRALKAKSEDKVFIAKVLLRKAFSPVRNQNKINNGWSGFAAVTQVWHGWPTNNAHIRYEAHGRTRNYKLLGVEATEILTEDEIVQYEAIYAEVLKVGIARKYAYFFTRQDLFAEYQLVQTAHAALELGAKLPANDVKNLYFTVCGVKNISALDDVEHLLKILKLDYIVFREPDIGNQKTSIAVYPIEEHKRGILMTYNLLKFENDKSRKAE